MELKLKIYISSIPEDLVFSRKGPTKLFCDNTSAIIMANSKKPTERAKHIDVYHFFIHEWVELKQVIL